MELEVETLASSGDGLSRHEGYALFVPTGLPGDRAEVEVVKTTPRFGTTRLISLTQDSPDRILAPCPVFPRCGGCALQSLNYEKQMEFKVQWVIDSLERIGKIKPPDDISTLPAEQIYHYRNKGSFALQKTGSRVRIGFFENRSHDVVNSDQCDTLLPRINEVKEWVRLLLDRHKISIYDERAHKGFLRGLVVRHSESTGKTLLGLATMPGEFPPEFLGDLLEDPQKLQLSGIVQNINAERTNIILGESSRTLWGEDTLEDRLGELTFQLSLNSFFQVNPYQTTKLYDLVRDWASFDKGRVVDAYCGVGGIGLWLAAAGARVAGVEENPKAAADARINAGINRLEQCEFFEGPIESHMQSLAKAEPVQTLIFDPPRKGCSPEVLQAVPEMNPEKIIYISCNPSTLARDLDLLDGYEVAKLCVVDMFPQTSHVETAVLLVRK